MTERERILSILRREQPDQLPWCADLAYWVDALKTDGVYPERYRDTDGDNGLQKLHRDLGAGFYLQGYEPFQAKRKDTELVEKQDGNRFTRIYRTPYGELTEVSEFSRISYSWGITKHLIEDIEDLKIYGEICEKTAYTADYELAEKRRETVGDNGVVLCYTPKSPLMELIALRAGIENFTYLAADNGGQLEEILGLMEAKSDEACQLALDSPAECIMIPENISSECVKPFYHWMRGYHQKWTERIRKAGKYSFVHLDGTVRGLVRELSWESGFDVIEAITPMPVGDIEIGEVRKLVRPETVLWGGIPGGFFTENTSDGDFDAHILRCIQVMTESPRYVLGVADQVVPGSTVERLKRVRQLVEQYGHYR